MTQQPQRLTWALTSRHFRKNHRACSTAEEWECGPREWMTPWICNKEFTCLTRLYGNALYIWLTTQSRSIHLYYTLFFFMEDAPLLLQMSYRFNENCTVAHNGSFSARLNVSLCWNFPFLSPPLLPLLWHSGFTEQLVSEKQGREDQYQRRSVFVWLAGESRFRFPPETQRCFLTWFVFIHTMSGPASLVSK